LNDAADSFVKSKIITADLSSGYVGIGCDSTSYALEVVGSVANSTSTTWTNTSDERVKTNIETIENGLDKINKLRPVTYNYTEEYLELHPELSPTKKYNSFIAQEYGEVFPDAVNIGPDLTKISAAAVHYTDDEELPEGKNVGDIKVEETREVLVEGVMDFTPHDLFMYLTKAIQELSAKVKALESA